MDIERIQFTVDHLPIVQSFECGSSDSATHASEWIKNSPPFPCALKSIQDYDTSVWLYRLDDCIIGFGSIGLNKWPIPPPDGPKQTVGYIPMLAVASPFQRKSHDDVRYSQYIVRDLINEANTSRDYSQLCLLVHEDNAAAVKLYRKEGFVEANGRYREKFIRMILALNSGTGQTDAVEP